MTESKRRCPYCHSELDEGDLFCKVCGRGVPLGNVRDIEDNSIHIDRRHDYTENVTKNYNTTNNNTNYNTNNRNTYNYYNGQSRKPMSKKAIVGIVALCIIVLIVAICIVGVVNNKPVEETYTLTLTSNPNDGVNIYIDEVYKGKTPLTVSGIPAGTHVLRATQEGFTDYTNIITVPTQGSIGPITLTKLSGSLNIYASESMALVFVDESYYGTAPVTISSIEPGSHVVKVSKDGFYDATEVVSVTAGTVKNVTLTLSPIIQPTVIPTQIPTVAPTVKPTTIPTSVPTQTPTVAPTVMPTTIPTQVPTPTPEPKGHVVISTNKEGVSVYIDDVQKGTTAITPLDISGVTAGTHTLKLTKNNYVDITQVIDVPAGEYVSLSFTMELVDHPILESREILEFLKGKMGTSASLKPGSVYDGAFEVATNTPLTLDLNGGIIKGSGRYAIKIGAGQSLTIKDSIGSGKITGATGGKVPEAYSEIVGAGVIIEEGGTFILESGSICNNEGKDTWYVMTVIGCGVLNYGTFIMNGGYITDNTAQSGTGAGRAAGVMNYGTFIMNGGLISHNHCYSSTRGGSSSQAGVWGAYTHNGGEVID